MLNVLRRLGCIVWPFNRFVCVPVAPIVLVAAAVTLNALMARWLIVWPYSSLTSIFLPTFFIISFLYVLFILLFFFYYHYYYHYHNCYCLVVVKCLWFTVQTATRTPQIDRRRSRSIRLLCCRVAVGTWVLVVWLVENASAVDLRRIHQQRRTLGHCWRELPSIWSSSSMVSYHYDNTELSMICN